MRTKAEVEDFVGYIEGMLLPDLLESGCEAMATDWLDAIEIIKQLQNEAAK